MPTPTEGQIALVADIAGEFTDLGTSNVSLFAARDEAGLDAGQVAMTQFYNLSDAVASTVSTDSTANVSTSQIRVYGNVTNDGGATITERGFYFGTSSNYASNTKYSVGGTTGSFNRLFTGLNSNTTYYYTAYAINSVGESRGTTKSQLTSFSYTFKSPIYAGASGRVNGGGMYYSNVSGGWTLRSSYATDSDGDLTGGCISVPTNRQARSYMNAIGIGNSVTIQKNGFVCNGPSLSISSISMVGGSSFSYGGSYATFQGSGSAHDFRFTAT